MIVDSLTAPLTYDFFRRALLMGLIAGVIGPVVGSYLIVQRLGFLANVISHAVLPGLVIAQAIGLDISIGAFLSGLLSSGLLTWIQSQAVVKPDAAMNAILASFFALGMLLIPILGSRLNLEGFLFGDILSVSPTDLWRSGSIAVGVLLAIALCYRPLLYYSFDPVGAAAIGLPVRWLEFGLVTAMSLTIIAGMQAVGVILIIALISCPALAAYLLVRELHWMLVLSSVIGVASAWLGLYGSYYLNLPSGPAIALISFLAFLAAFLFSPSRGIWGRSRAKSKLS
ncbi:metal ABC transporter permease [Synechococcus elongatus]|uniref:Manganese transport system membrane protein MntB n=2 Tax=Synechococcus elongatus TaxID=32046 RepID=Q31NM1_SYNE7|nr:metal ABC transporter permease [Synechococcus elongatus]MBD2688466.1 metal ABC transporter permease [Synechococcus elongatus FACHB-1061]ABB57348.1 manganese transport system membrane protein MntB [Synechococcus elongatus PCC 7942 = FACHB-805]MBD2587755.1 metal ABC transporter permease [Synechococcus elongatus FACHB-242]MBD2707537.1 metal ABC transporter permease [Synechococcus elongatus PCC 7942 = FACHB-805]UOW71132.1 manganese/iron transport system permease protein [Synechococcus elongatus